MRLVKRNTPTSQKARKYRADAIGTRENDRQWQRADDSHAAAVYKIENCAVAESNKRGYVCPPSYPIPRPEKY